MSPWLRTTDKESYKVSMVASPVCLIDHLPWSFIFGSLQLIHELFYNSKYLFIKTHPVVLYIFLFYTKRYANTETFSLHDYNLMIVWIHQSLVRSQSLSGTKVQSVYKYQTHSRVKIYKISSDYKETLMRVVTLPLRYKVSWLNQFLQPQSSLGYFSWSLSTLFSFFLQGCMRIAPSKRITSPFNMGFSAIAVTRCANSAGSPRREGKGTCLARKLCTFSGNPARSGVANRPVGKEETNRVKTMNYDGTWWRHHSI